VDRLRGRVGGAPQQERAVSGAAEGHADTESGARPNLRKEI